MVMAFKESYLVFLRHIWPIKYWASITGTFPWVRRSETITFIMLAHLYILANHYACRGAIQQIFYLWDTTPGIHSGTAMTMLIDLRNFACMTLVCPLGLVYSATGLARFFCPACSNPVAVARQVQPWIVLSLVWTGWIIFFNTILDGLLNPDSTETLAAGTLIIIPIVTVIVLLGTWLSLVPLVILTYGKQPVVRVIARLLIILSLVAALPLLLHQSQLLIQSSQWDNLLRYGSIITLAGGWILALLVLLHPLWFYLIGKSL